MTRGSGTDRYDPVRDSLAMPTGVERQFIPRASIPVNFERGMLPTPIQSDENDRLLAVSHPNLISQNVLIKWFV